MSRRGLAIPQTAENGSSGAIAASVVPWAGAPRRFALAKNASARANNMEHWPSQNNDKESFLSSSLPIVLIGLVGLFAAGLIFAVLGIKTSSELSNPCLIAVSFLGCFCQEICTTALLYYY